MADPPLILCGFPLSQEGSVVYCFTSQFFGTVGFCSRKQPLQSPTGLYQHPIILLFQALFKFYGFEKLTDTLSTFRTDVGYK